MGTYMQIIQRDENKIQETATFLEKVEDSEGYSIVGLWTQADIDIENSKINGTPDFLPLGVGQFKLSSTSEENIELFVNVVSEAMDLYGLEVEDLPSNADDYLSDEDIEKLYGLKNYQDFKQSEEEYWQGYSKAKAKALKEEQEKLNGGVMFVDSWGIKGFWLIFGNVEKPSYLKYEFEYDGEKHSDLYRDKEGNSYLLIPLMSMSHDGVEKVYEALAYAWDNLGLRTNILSILAQVYNVFPKQIKFGRTKLSHLDYVPNYDIDRAIIFNEEKEKFEVVAYSLAKWKPMEIKNYFVSASGIVFAIQKKNTGKFVDTYYEKELVA